MNTARAALACLSLTCVPWASWADAPDFAQAPDLPPPAEVTRAIDDYPPVRAARAEIRVERANRSKLDAGPYEFGVRAGTARRRVADPSDTYPEWDVALERPIRLPEKARVDGRLGEELVQQAQFAYGDAVHEAKRLLLRLWFAWLRESAQTVQLGSQIEFARTQLDVVRKRVRSGDVASFEIDLAEAAVAQAESSLRQADTRKLIAANALVQTFRIDLPETPVIATPQPVEKDLAYWQQTILQHNRELQVARAEGLRARLVAARANADRIPDPTVGIRYSSELGGAERVLGISVLIPIPGAARAASSSASFAQADAAAEKEASVIRKLYNEIDSSFAQGRAAFDSWQKTSAAAERVRRSSDLALRAYALGEIGLSEVLAARRQYLEVNLAATLAQIDASEARYRLLLDAHELWASDRE